MQSLITATLLAQALASPLTKRAFGAPFSLPTISASEIKGFIPGARVPFTFQQLSPLNPDAVVTRDANGVNLALKGTAKFPNGVTIRSTQSFNLGTACFKMTVDSTHNLGGVGATAYTLGVNSKANGGASQDGKSDEQDLEFIFGNNRKFQSNVFVAGKGGHEAYYTATPGSHLYCLMNDGTKLRWFKDGAQLVSLPRAPFVTKFTQARYMWFSLASFPGIAGPRAPGVPQWNQRISAFSFFKL